MFGRYGIVYINHTSFVYSSILGHLGCFYNLAMVKSPAMNIGMQYVVLAPLEKVLENCWAWPYIRAIFSLGRNIHPDFHSSWAAVILTIRMLIKLSSAHILTNICYHLFSWCLLFCRSEMESQCEIIMIWHHFIICFFFPSNSPM